MVVKKDRQDKRLRKKIEPYVWSYQILFSLVYLTVFGILIGLINFLLPPVRNIVFDYLIYLFLLSGQALSLYLYLKFFNLQGKILSLFKASVLLMSLIEAFFIWKYLFLLYQFLIMFGLASCGLAFIGYLSGEKQAKSFKIESPKTLPPFLLKASPFLWFVLFVLAGVGLPFLGVDQRNFIHFSLAPAVSVISALNIGFLGSLVKESISFGK